MWKSAIIFVTIIAVCYCQNYNNNSYGVYHHKKKPYYDSYFHGLLYGGGILYYLAFIAFKIKVAFVIGTILTIFVVAGKVIALIKYVESTKSHDKHEVVVPHSPVVHDYSPHYPVYDREVPEKPYFSPTMNNEQYYDSPPPHAYGRSSNVFEQYYELFLKMMDKFNITDAPFKEMKSGSNDCKTNCTKNET